MRSLCNRAFLFGFLLLSMQMHAAGPVKSFENVPLVFEPNRGQWNSSASFGVHAPGYSAFFQAADVSYRLQSGDRQAEVKMHWSGAAANRNIVAVDQLLGVANYYVGNDESRWISGLPTYRRLRVSQLYPGIDLIYYGTGRQMEYDLEIAPGADPSRIKLVVEGGKSRIDAGGNLIIETSAGTFIQHQPVAYQEIHGVHTSVSSRYVVNRDGTVKLALGRYDRRQKLVIDPTIAWGATLGSGTNGGGTANAVALDSSGNVFVAGETYATDLPISNAYDNTLNNLGSAGCCGLTDSFITKFSPDGTVILFSTYFGGSGFDAANGLAVDNSGNVIIVGFTSSADLGTKNAYQATLHGTLDGFVAKFGPTGAFLYGTFLGGNDYDSATAVAVDSLGNMFITGRSQSYDFPKSNAYQPTLKGRVNAFLTKIAPDGASLIFSTYLGGINDNVGTSLALGQDGSIYLSGWTEATNFPTTTNAFQPSAPSPFSTSAFVTRFAASGANLIYSTYLSGTAQISQAYGIDVDTAGAAYISGSTTIGFPIKNAARGTFTGLGSNQFLTKLSADGTALVYSTYLGDVSNPDRQSAVRVDATSNATVVGRTSSSDFPTLAAFRPSTFGNDDGFVTKFNTSGAIVFSSFLGGNSNDRATSIALDSAGNTYIAGSTSSSDFPRTATRFVETPFIVKITGPVISVPVTFNTVPVGLNVLVDGAVVTTPNTFQWAPGVTHQISVPVPQITTGPSANNFASWSIGGANFQNVTTPVSATTYTANLTTQACTYSLSQTSITVGQASPTSRNVTLTTQFGCPWTATSNDSWIYIISAQANSTGPIAYSVGTNTGGTRTGSITVAGRTLTITQSYTTPTLNYSSTCCYPNSGLSQVFPFIVQDEDGIGDLTVTNMLINNYLDGRGACYLAFDHVGKVLYLVNDAGTAIAGMPFDAFGRGSGVLSNSQCSVDGTKTNAQSDTVQVTLNLGLSFTSAFGGNKVIYFAARDKEGLNSGWIPSGVWNVPMTATNPSVLTSSFNFNSSNPSTISVTYRDAALNTNLSPSQILINDALDGRNACYMGYDHPNNRLFLLDDAGTTLLPAITPGVGTGTQQNSQCIIYSQGSSVSANGRDYTLNVAVLFQPAFQGRRIVYAATQTTTGGNSGWQAINAFTVQ